MEDKMNQPEKIPAPKVRKITPLDLLKRDVKLYRADCMMSVGNDKKCRPCTAAFFESIIGMIDRIALQEAIARQERKTGKWIRQGGIHNMYTRYACSECGREIDMYYDFGNIPTDADVINEFPYCHCGAKMEVDYRT